MATGRSRPKSPYQNVVSGLGDGRWAGDAGVRVSYGLLHMVLVSYQGQAVLIPRSNTC